MKKYTIGVDFGSLSGRAVLVEITTGIEISTCTCEYAHHVMTDLLPNGTPLPSDWALQHPSDYLDVIKTTIPEVIAKAGVSAEDIIGVGIDFTASTVMPVTEDGTPLCFLDEYSNDPHAYVKLWKHHSAQNEATEINRIARETGQQWMSRYGGKISSEWMFPKLVQLLHQAPRIYERMAFFIEAGDWIVWQLTGTQVRSCCAAGYKAFWNRSSGYPDRSFFAAIDERLENVVERKLKAPLLPPGSKAGYICPRAANMTGLTLNTAVAVANVDAHVTVPGVRIDGPGKLLAIMGTSTCHMLLSDEEKLVPGICGVIEDGIYPGLFGYEAGQSGVGDQFEWFINNCLPATYLKDALIQKKNIHCFLREKAERLAPGESGLLALDWWNGNRSVLVDMDLSGLILGLTLQTKPEEIYRALIEATAFGTRKIIETFRENGLVIKEFYASGGISQKDPMTMQIYADVINMPVKIAGSAQGPALGSAIFGAVAAGSGSGGYDSISDAAQVMGKIQDRVYLPEQARVEIYNRLYAEYKQLHDYFGLGANDIMKRLKKIKKNNTEGWDQLC